jgi:hypothetical protein
VSEYLFPNIAVKQGIEEFLALNPWAFEYNVGESYVDIEF